MKQTIDDFVKYIEEEHNIEIVRNIKVVYKDGKKRPYGEKSSMSVAQIRENRCSVDTPNTYSIAIKYVPNFYCIDFDYFEGEPINDTMEYDEMVERSPLAKLLDDNDCFRIKTKKGWHFYLYINDFPIFQNNTNVGNDEKFDIDMFGSKREEGASTWETYGREVIGQAHTFDRDDILQHFDYNKLKIKKDDFSEPEPDVVKAELIKKDVNDEIVLSLLARMKSPTRGRKYQTWMDVGMALCNMYNGKARGRKMWDKWSKENSGDMYDEDDLEEQYSKLKGQLDKRENKYNIQSLKRWAQEDSPEITNKYQDAYNTVEIIKII